MAVRTYGECETALEAAVLRLGRASGREAVEAREELGAATLYGGGNHRLVDGQRQVVRRVADRQLACVMR